MLIKIFGASSEEEVYELLQRADVSSFSRTGSHDDTGIAVGVNAQPRPPRQSVYSWTSVQHSDYEKRDVLPGPLPSPGEIETAWVLETYAHYGSSSRARSVLQVFARSRRGLFLMFDLGEVGPKDDYRAPFHGTSIFEALWEAKKKVRVEVQGSEALNLALAGFGWSGHQYHFEGRFAKALRYLRPEVSQEWFQIAVREAMRMFSDIHRVASSACDTDRPDRSKAAARALWPDTALGRLLAEIRLS